jgi:hypothetical protein
MMGPSIDPESRYKIMANKNTKKPSKSAPKKAEATREIGLEPGVDAMFKIVLYKHLRFKTAAPRDLISLQLAEDTPDKSAVMLESGSVKVEASEDSFEVVASHVAAQGGELVSGWIVVECEGLFLEAMPRAVWRGEDGQLVDLSTSPLKENLFIAGASCPEDGPLPNKFKQLSEHPYVTAWVHLRREEDTFQKRFYEGDEYNGALLSLSDYFSWRLNFEAQDPEVPTLKDFLLMNIIFIQHQLSAAQG